MTTDAGERDASVPSDGGRGDASVGKPQLVINELMARNTSTLADEMGEFDDWLELHNRGSVDADLTGASLSDDPLQPNRHIFSSGIVVPAHGYLVIFADGQPEQGARHIGFKLGGSGETISLRWTDGSLLDEVTYGAQDDDVSHGRFPDGTGDFIRMTTPTPGAANTDAMRDAGVPDAAVVVVDAGGGIDASVATGVVINEFLASNVTGIVDEQQQHEDWIELYNTTSLEKDLTGHALSDTPTLPLWTFAPGTRIAPHGYLVVFADSQPEQGPLHAGFNLAAVGESVALIAPDGTELDSVDYGPQTADISLARQPDATGGFLPLNPPTPGAANSAVTTDGGQ